MFDLEQAIAEWRRKMVAAGVRKAGVIDELESHLRDEFERRVRAGSPDVAAFQASVDQMGGAQVLQSEFAKVRSPILARLRNGICTLAGIQDHYLIMNTNNSTSLVEPRWATYLKGSVFVAPAFLAMTFCMVFVYPKLQQICRTANVGLPRVYDVTNAISEHFGLIAIGIAAALILLEWRSRNWSQYRRATLGVTVFAVNAAVLVLITLMVIMALIAAAGLMHHAK